MAISRNRYNLTTMQRSHRFGYLGLALVVLGALVSACAGSDRPQDAVHVLTWDGEVSPVMERYVKRGLDSAADSHARAVVLRLDTPGGFDSSMRGIIKRMQASSVPVIVYVSPSGGRAASAGTFITMASHVAAMAPGTTIGAATPINASGDDIEGDLGRKVQNDAVAYIRGLAQQHSRNADWAEKAVREGVAVGTDEAVKMKIVDFEAGSLDDVLKQANGRSVQVAGGPPVILQTTGAKVTYNDQTVFEQLLDRLANPNIAFLLLTLGALALLSEIVHPSFFAGILGVIALVFAYFALGSLEANWAGAALVLFGVALLGSDVFIDGHGVLSAGGVIALALGGLILFNGSESGVEVSRWLVLGMTVLAGLFVAVLVTAIFRARRMSRERATTTIVGARGKARSNLAPDGMVRVWGETWFAKAEGREIADGEDVIVTSSTGLSLKVRALNETVEAPTPKIETPA
jgi:membrane-bound serine protease (ClpP class)